MREREIERERKIMNCFPWINSVLIVLVVAQANFILCWSLNDEGIALLKFRERVVNDPFGALSSWNEDAGKTDHCSWFGIDCSDDGHVVSLHLQDLHLKGTLAPELGNLLRMKSIILRNNSFFGCLPEDIGELKELKLLDLSYNNLSGPLPPDLRYDIPTLLLDNNDISCYLPPEYNKHVTFSEVQLHAKHLTNAVEVLPYTRHNNRPRHAVHLHRRMLSRKLQVNRHPGTNSPGSGGVTAKPPPRSQSKNAASNPSSQQVTSNGPSTPPPTPTASKPRQPPPPPTQTAPKPRLPPPPPTQTAPKPQPSQPQPKPGVSTPRPHLSSPIGAQSPPSAPHKAKLIPIVAAAVGGFSGLVLVIGIYIWRTNQVMDVAPWATGLSGQLQKAFVTGIPSLKKSELETACEDFSNIIGSSSLGTEYKGTLSNGIEIAVIILPVTSAKGWSRSLERQFRKKISTLSKVNHKNFVNLIGYCVEMKPFSRMLVFEYAPNGSLFEHLHIREAEHLDWGMRLRVMMGMAYCLEHMHQLTPPITHPNLSSSSVNLSEDYAAKISDFCVWNEISGAQVRPIGMGSLSPSAATPESNVYSFGLVLLEIMTGRSPDSLENNSLESWVSGFLRGEQCLEVWVDPMLRHFNPEQLEKISEVIRKCLHPDRKKRLTMRDATARLRDITGIDRDKASPRLSPLWWAELEICSVNAE